VKQAGLDDKETYQIYEAYAQLPRSGTTFIVQTASEPMAMLPAVRHAIQQVGSAGTSGQAAHAGAGGQRSRGAAAISHRCCWGYSGRWPSF